MKIIKRIFEKLKNPNLLTVIIAVVLFAAAAAGTVLIIVFNISPYIAYVCYALSAILFGYVIYLIVLACKKLKPRYIAFMEKRGLTKRFVQDYGFRTMIFALFALVISLGYAVFNCVYGIIYMSYWHVALAVYYVLLSIVRGCIVVRARNDAAKVSDEGVLYIRKLNTYATTGVFLIILTFVLGSVLWLMTALGYGFLYADLLIYVAAVYTVYKISMAVYNVVKVRGLSDYSVRAVRNINLADALVSLLALQTAMLAAFSIEGADYDWATASLGTVACVFTMALGIFMIVKSSKERKKLNSQKECLSEN